MVDKPSLLSHLSYSVWADALLLESVSQLSDEELHRNLGASHSSILATLQHIYYADRVWFSRLQQNANPPGADPEPGPSLDDLKQELPRTLRSLRAWVEELSDEEVATECRGRLWSGREIVLPRWQIVMHVVNHATLHRGQVVAMLRQLGHSAPATDLLYFYLQNSAQIMAV